MKKFFKKGVVLFAAAMAVCAFAVPVVASAASWGVAGSHHDLTAVGFGFSNHTGLTSQCADMDMTARVHNAQVMTITNVAFTGSCTTSFPAAGAHCTTTSQATNLPWILTAVTTTLIQIHGIHIDIKFDDVPNMPGSCGGLTGATLTLSGTLTNGHWAGNAAREVRYTRGTGLVTNAGQPVTVFGTILDATGGLTVSP